MTAPVSTDPAWDGERGITWYLPPPRDPTWSAGWTSPTATGATITPPEPAPEPPEAPHPADHRLMAIERACATLQRQALIIAEWAQYIAHQARKARGQ